MSPAKKNLLSLSLGLLVIGVTVCIYLLTPPPRNDIGTLTFGGILFAEIVSLVSVMGFSRTAKKSALVLLSGAYTSIALYFILFLLSSLLFGFYYHQPRAYVIVGALLTALLLISLVLIGGIGHKITADSLSTEKQLASFHLLTDALDLLRSDPDNRDFQPLLDTLYEQLKNSDQSCFISTDRLIQEKVARLKKLLSHTPRNPQDIENLCDRILQLIKRRNLEVMRMKPGQV